MKASYNHRIIFTLILLISISPAAFAGQRGNAPPVVEASTPRVSESYDVTLVHANLDLDGASDDYGIYEKLKNLQDAEVIVRRNGIEYQLIGLNAADYLLRSEHVYYRNGVGLIASDKLKQFVGIRNDGTSASGGAEGEIPKGSRPQLLGAGGSQVGNASGSGSIRSVGSGKGVASTGGGDTLNPNQDSGAQPTYYGASGEILDSADAQRMIEECRRPYDNCYGSCGSLLGVGNVRDCLEIRCQVYWQQYLECANTQVKTVYPSVAGKSTNSPNTGGVSLFGKSVDDGTMETINEIYRKDQ